MHRLIVAILAAVDAAIAVAVGIAATLAPLTLLWVFALGGGANWSALWPASGVIWQFGNLVPIDVTIPADYIAVAGIDPSAASFTLSLAPLAFAGFTAIFAARSAVRASRAEAWITGVLAGTLCFAALSTLVALTAANGVASATLWQAVLLPTLVFAGPAIVAGAVVEWREAGAGAIARVRDRVERAPRGWGEAPGLVARGVAVVVTGLIGLGAVLVTVALVLRGGEIIALYEAAHLDVLGATMVTLAQLAYLPTLVVWGLAFIAGPGFAVGAGTSVAPAGTQVGVVPGIPVLGILPESTTPWLLLLALCPVAVGALAGWIARSRLTPVGAAATRRATEPPATPAGASRSTDAAPDLARTLDLDRTSLLTALLESPAAPEPTADAEPEPVPGDTLASPLADEPIVPRLVIALGIALVSAGIAALLAALANGSMGPGRLAVMGPAAGPMALAIGLEVLLGAAILLLSPRARPRAVPAASPAAAPAAAEALGGALVSDAPTAPQPVPDEDPIDEPVARTKPAEPFTFPTLPRMPPTRTGEGEGQRTPPVD